jgi:hypothetical protein
MSGPFAFRGSWCPGGLKPLEQSLHKVLFRSISKLARTGMLRHPEVMERTNCELPLLRVCFSLTSSM